MTPELHVVFPLEARARVVVAALNEGDEQRLAVWLDNLSADVREALATLVSRLLDESA